MARQKPKKTKKSPKSKPKKSAKKTQRIVPLSQSGKLNQGDPTSEAELAALFDVSRPEEGRRDAKPVEYKPERRPLPWGKISLAAVLLVAVCSYGWLRWRLKQSLVPEEGNLTVQGLTAEVQINRDSHGVPHIKATNLNDMAFGAGFAMASDRSFQMEFLKRMAYGRLSEVLGEETLGIDIYMRSLGFRNLTEKNFQILTPKLQEMLKGYAAGVNAQRKAFTQGQFEYLLLGMSPEEWQPSDSLALYQLFSFLLASNHLEEVAFLKFAAAVGLEKAAWLFPIYEGEPLPFEEARRLKDIDFKKITGGDAALRASLDKAESLWQNMFPSPSIPASNNWVVAPSRARNKKSLLANDTHLQMSVPAMWYMMNLECPEYRAAGVALPGTPIVALGFNGKIAWGATMVMADNQDIFLEQMRVENGVTQYLYKGKWENATVNDETITIRGGKTHSFKRTRTGHGVLLNDAFSHPFPDPHLAINIRSDYGLAYRTTVGAKETTIIGIFEMGLARDMKSARAALDKVTGIYLNMVYADEKNIGWVATGRYPVRKGASGLLPRIGWTGENDWDGYYLPNENPSSLNPREGFVATANHKIWNDETELWVSSSWYGSDRAERAKELIASRNDLTSADMASFQGDQVSRAAKRFMQLLVVNTFQAELTQAIAELPAAENNKAREALTILQGFDGALTKESKQALVYQNFVSAMTELTFGDEIGNQDKALWQNFQAINKRSYNAVHDHLLGQHDSPFWDKVNTHQKETKATIFAEALALAISLCEKQLGSNRDAWAWGKVHQYYWRHQFTKKAGFLKYYLNRGPVEAGGDLTTLSQAGNLWGDNHDVWLIPAMRFIVDFSADEPAQLMLHMGESGNAESQHYDDMIPLFTGVKHLPLPMKPDAVARQYSKSLRLRP